jgi:hypothetical protein
MQADLRLAQQPTPASAEITRRQVRKNVVAEHAARRRERRQTCIARQGEIPARFGANRDRAPVVAEQGLERRHERLGFLARQAQFAAGEQATRPHVGTHMRRIGAQPGMVRGVGTIEIARDRCDRQAARQQVEMALDLGFIARIDGCAIASRKYSREQRSLGWIALQRLARRQQQRRRGRTSRGGHGRERWAGHASRQSR